MAHPLLFHLITDFSSKAPEYTIYNALLYRHFGAVSVINSNQDFKHGEIIAPGIFMRLVLPAFAPSTIHICSLHIESKLREKHVLVQCMDQLFVGPDNGVFPIAFDSAEAVYYQLGNPASGADIFKEIYLPSLKVLSENQWEPEGLFAVEESPRRSLLSSPTISGNIIRLTVLYNDAQGNAYLNIDKAEFARLTQGKKFQLKLGFKDTIDDIGTGYDNVPEGQRLAFFGGADLLQIAVNCGSAAQYLGLVKGKIVMLELLTQ